MTNTYRKTMRSQRDEAAKHGKARHHKRNSDTTKHWDDDRGHYYSETIGVLGEILFRSYIEAIAKPLSAWTIEHSPLEALAKPTPWDDRINGYTVEVKTVPPGIKYRNMLVKKAEFHPVDYWVAIKLLSETKHRIVGFAVMKELLANGITTKFGKAPCYWRPLVDLRPMDTLMWFPHK